ncbi:MAG: hypothetical protein IH595_05675 [Bacteroidales bacterium]|nr:hypothetical protein [Bacteroidales bacterium]
MRKILLLSAIIIITSTAMAQIPEGGFLSVNTWKSIPEPFMFSATTLTPKDLPWTLSYSGGYGERVAGPFGLDGLEQKVSLKGYLGKGFTCFAFAGLGFPRGNVVNSAEQVEVIRNFIGGKKAQGFKLGIGLGASRDYDNVGALLSRVVLYYDLVRWKFVGNVLIQKAFAKYRDNIDVITSLGVNYRVSESLYGGVEAIGEDIEGLWEADAEGGAKVMVGPSINWIPDNSKFSFSVSGGPVMYASHSKLIDPNAIRTLPFQNGLTLRAKVVFNLSGV